MLGAATMTSQVNTNILVEAKKEYTKHICSLLTPIIIDSIQNIYNECKIECEKNQDPELLRSFQQQLKSIPKWNQDIIDKEYDNVVGHEDCDILDDLIKAIFVTNIKILSSVSNVPKVKKVQIEIPSSKRFIHKCYIESAREIYKDPFLFTHDVSVIELNRNLKDVYRIVDGAIEEAIRLLLPVKQILREYMGDDLTEEEVENVVNQTQMIGGGASSNNTSNEQQQPIVSNSNEVTATVDNKISTVEDNTNVPLSMTQLQPQLVNNQQQLQQLQQHGVSNETSNNIENPIIDDDVDPTPSPPRSPKFKLFPSPRNSKVSPSPLMKVLGAYRSYNDSDSEDNDNSDSEEEKKIHRHDESDDNSNEDIDGDVDMNIRPISLSESFVDADEKDTKYSKRYDSSSSVSNESPRKSFLFESGKRRRASVPSMTIVDKSIDDDSDEDESKRAVQEDIKAIVLGTKIRDRTRDGYGYNRQNNDKYMQENRYRNKNILFSVEKEPKVKRLDKPKERQHEKEHIRDKERQHEKEHIRDKEHRHDKSRNRDNERESFINFDRSKKKNLFFDNDESEDFTLR